MQNSSLRIKPILEETKMPCKKNISEGEIALWCIPLPSQPQKQRTLQKLITSEELKKAKRLPSPKEQIQAIASRAAMRLLLAHYLQTPPKKIQFHYSSNGKPYLKNTPITFNLSHSGSLALLAITHTMPIGIDLEKINPHRPIQRLAKRHFSIEECKWIEAQPQPTTAFYQLWVFKEALAKASASSLYQELHTKILPPSSKPFRAKQYMLHPLYLSAEYAAALATSASNCKITICPFGEKQWEC